MPKKKNRKPYEIMGRGEATGFLAKLGYVPDLPMDLESLIRESESADYNRRYAKDGAIGVAAMLLASAENHVRGASARIESLCNTVQELRNKYESKPTHFEYEEAIEFFRHHASIDLQGAAENRMELLNEACERCNRPGINIRDVVGASKAIRKGWSEAETRKMSEEDEKLDIQFREAVAKLKAKYSGEEAIAVRLTFPISADSETTSPDEILRNLKQSFIKVESEAQNGVTRGEIPIDASGPIEGLPEPLQKLREKMHETIKQAFDNEGTARQEANDPRWGFRDKARVPVQPKRTISVIAKGAVREVPNPGDAFEYVHEVNISPDSFRAISQNFHVGVLLKADSQYEAGDYIAFTTTSEAGELLMWKKIGAVANLPENGNVSVRLIEGMPEGAHEYTAAWNDRRYIRPPVETATVTS